MLARSQRRARGLLGAARGDRPTRIDDGWFHTGDGGVIDDERLPHDHRPQEGRDHLRRRERVVDRGRGRALPPPGGRRGRGDRRARREVGRDGQGARRAGAPGADADRGRADRPLPSEAGRATSARRRSSSATSSPAPPPASCRSSSCARRTGRAATARSTDPYDPGRGVSVGSIAARACGPSRCESAPPRPGIGGRRRHRRRRPLHDDLRKRRLDQGGERRAGVRDRDDRAGGRRDLRREPTTTTLPTTTLPTTTVPPTTTTLPPVSQNHVFVMGDSVLLGAAEEIPPALPGWNVIVDAKVSRFLNQGIEVLQARRAEIGAGGVVVIQQGNNYLGSEQQFREEIDQTMAVLAGVPKVVWITVSEFTQSRVDVNSEILAAARAVSEHRARRLERHLARQPRVHESRRAAPQARRTSRVRGRWSPKSSAYPRRPEPRQIAEGLGRHDWLGARRAQGSRPAMWGTSHAGSARRAR